MEVGTRSKIIPVITIDFNEIRSGRIAGDSVVQTRRVCQVRVVVTVVVAAVVPGKGKARTVDRSRECTREREREREVRVGESVGAWQDE